MNFLGNCKTIDLSVGSGLPLLFQSYRKTLPTFPALLILLLSSNYSTDLYQVMCYTLYSHTGVVVRFAAPNEVTQAWC